MLFSVILCLQVFSAFVVGEKAEEAPGFFLKVTKNIPRIGRSSGGEFENFFLKQSKSVPRIGRRNSQAVSPSKDDPFIFFSQHYSLPYKNIIPFDSTIIPKISQALRQQDFTFISWDDLDNALERDIDLYFKLYELGKMKENLAYLIREEEANPNFLENVENSFYRVNRAAETAAQN